MLDLFVHSIFLYCFSNCIEMRNKYKDAFLKTHSIKLGFMSPFIRASAYALQSLPVVNAVIDDKEIIYRDYVDISVAVATPKVFFELQSFMLKTFLYWGESGRGWADGCWSNNIFDHVDHFSSACLFSFLTLVGKYVFTF